MKKSIKWILAFVLGCAVTAGAADWQEDFEAASAEAKESGKYLLLDFSGSDWCGWCIKLDKEVFSKKAFKEYAEDNLVLVMLDFPQKKKQPAKVKKQNEALAKKYEVEGFPTVVLLDSEGNLVDTTGYQAGGPEAYVESLQKMIAEHEAANKDSE